MRNKYIEKPWLYFWHPLSGFVGGIIFGVILVAVASFMIPYILALFW